LNVYEIVTTRIIDQLQQGTIPWRKPWRTSTAEPRNLVSGKAYRGHQHLPSRGAGLRIALLPHLQTGDGAGRGREAGRKGLPGRLLEMARAR
jgi:hypothetical protein